MATAFVFNPLTGNLDLVAAPTGPAGALQFYNNGQFSGSANLTWTPSAPALTVDGSVLIGCTLSSVGVDAPVPGSFLVGPGAYTGDGAAPYQFQQTFTSPTQADAFETLFRFNPTDHVGSGPSGLVFLSIMDGTKNFTGTGTTPTVNTYFGAESYTTGAIAELVNGYFNTYLDNGTAVALSEEIVISEPWLIAGASIATRVGIRIRNQQAGTTNNYGLLIDQMTGGHTLDRAIDYANKFIVDSAGNISTTGTITIGGALAASASNVVAFTNKSGNISQWTNDSGYLTSVTNISGNAGTATALQTARNINGVSFNGTADITVTAAAATLTGLGSGVATWLATPSSANLLAAMTTKTGTGSLAFATAPTLTGPVTLTEVAGSSGLTITGATQTTSFPAFSMTQTWNASGVTFTCAKLNVTDTASAVGSLLLDLQVGGASAIAFERRRQIVITGVNSANNKLRLGNPSSSDTAGISYESNALGQHYSLVGDTTGSGGPTQLKFGSGATVTWQSTARSDSGTTDVIVGRGGAAATVQFGVDLNGAAVSQILQSCNGIAGTDKTGGNFTLRPGVGTGAGAVSSLIFQTPTVTTTGTTAQVQATRLTVDSSGLTIADGMNLVLNTTTGTKFGTATSQKIGFYNATPVVQRADMSALTDSTTGTPSLTLNDVGVVFSQAAINNNFASVLTQINKVRTALRDMGIMA